MPAEVMRKFEAHADDCLNGDIIVRTFRTTRMTARDLPRPSAFTLSPGHLYVAPYPIPYIANAVSRVKNRLSSSDTSSRPNISSNDSGYSWSQCGQSDA